MNKLCKAVFPILFFISISSFVIAQNNFFTDAGANVAMKATGKRNITPEKYRGATLNVQAMKNFLWSLPSEKSIANKQQAPILELPMPDGSSAKFHIWESPIMEPGLAAKYPEIKTFEGQGIDDPYATVHLDYNPYFGFSAQVLSVKGNTYIDPYSHGDINFYQSYYAADNKRNPAFICNTVQSSETESKNLLRTEAICRGTQLYTYRLALACTGEYATAVSFPFTATVPITLAAMVTTVNRVDGVYESELDVKLVLVANTDQLIYLDGTTDPYTNNNGSSMLGQNQTNVDAVIGNTNYDIGHVFSTGGGGIAALGVVCEAGSKARGVTGAPNPVGDNFDIDYVAHEMGHEFGANHTFNSSAANCGGGNRNDETAYEVGSGTTIMAYAGICSSDDIQPHSDPFFHAASFDEIANYISGTGGSCAVISNTGNNIPVITSMSNNGVNIPANTPFTLTATATDPDSDPLTYDWEEWDLGPTTTWNGGNANSTSPLFKSRPPKTTGSRTFPDMSLILSNYSLTNSDLAGNVMGGNKGETLPTGSRTMNFKLTVRDNRAGGGGVTSGGTGGCQTGFNSPFSIHVVGGTGPFIETYPIGGETFVGGEIKTVTWNVAGTAAAPISAANVKISLSTDGGLTFPTVLAASVPNNGSADVTIPNVSTSTARIKIEAIGNIFFALTASNFIVFVPNAPFIITQPGNDTVCIGSDAVFSVAAAGLNLNYQWQIKKKNDLGFSNIPSAISNTYTENSVTSTMDSNLYRCIITGSVAPAAISDSVLLNVIAPVTISFQPVNASVCSAGPLNSGNVSFTVAGNSTQQINYQWQVSTDGGNTFNDINIAAATIPTLSLIGVDVTMNNYQYRCKLSNATCTTPTVSNPATLTVYNLPTVNLSASPYTNLFPGLTTTLTATPTPAAGTNLTWYYNTNLITDQTSTSLVADVTDLGTYRVQIEDVNGCRNQSSIVTIADSASTKLFIYPNPNLGQFTVSYYNPGGFNTQRTITIYDSHGAKVYNGKFAVNAPYQLLHIDMKIPQRGIYFVVLGNESGKKIAEGKLLIH